MSAYSGGAGIHLQNLILDSSVSAEKKADCLKLLKVVIKNLADPIKSKDPKYRKLRVENEKIKNKLLACPAAMDYLKAIGFSETMEGTENILKVQGDVNLVLMQASLAEVTNGYNMVATKENVAPSASSTKKARVESPARKTVTAFPTKLSEKQKARILKEEKDKLEREEAKRHRAKTSALIKQDKYVRENDPNWKSGVNAAAAKSGTGISTFRDRYGE
uniref:PUB domain-containing protein n=1 Tax=Grammatophora oceanica TaxID=210454 RepID=A0A7S1Y413_9STRA|mmetsp:Transcript_17562/g.26037  ORF Transcript_17562/g.26037 Transcript_17562/m.26037 type:complete len:219 (+) Transcript_17562:89-745(+)|eukprot:CAMPEP_0194049260 /NCGR_PEP_ID=MMETSP0009_2-20130614/30180_1 /TAXON_ID=210454 /ORGANISM="Grammatophora oceanica, Strain CCMP 410" /LENGTH=218 /DNA_ID=CAMNT_0038695369 /DNA_START=87 /DNA_END=743 /DNA_ORIENTATION=+